MAEVTSTFQKGPAYRYIRDADRLPTYDDMGDKPTASIKLFDPTGSWTWYIAAYDPEDGNAYGLVDGHEVEVGSFHMPELVEYRGRFGLPLERDLHWTPEPLDALTSTLIQQRRKRAIGQ